MSGEKNKEYDKLVKLYEKYLAQWKKVFGDVQAAESDGPGGGTNPPPPPPPPPPQ